jgi:glycosyltransferase involved in cell wall biosynthesis
VANRLRRERWDVVYTNAQGSLSWLLWPLKRGPVRLIHHYHTAGDERDGRTWGWLFPKWLGVADEVVACSVSTARNLRRVLGADGLRGRDGRDKVRVIPYLADQSAPGPRPAKRDSGAKLRFGFVGRMVRGKGIDMICDLSRDPALGHIEWHLHGCGADYAPAHFDGLPNVHYHGRYQGAAELGSILARLDALVLFSRYQEGQPISLIEGMSAGLPWIATDQGGTRELMWSPSNCRLLPADCALSDARAAVIDLAIAIGEGRTSSTAQRRAYDDHLAPGIVGERWLDFLEAGQAPHMAFLDEALPAMKLNHL